MEQEGKKKIVVFDTNIYRDLTLCRDENSLKDLICRIVASEKEHGFSAYICPAVAGELIQHFIQDKQDCINGAKAMYWHCGKQILPFIYEWNSEHYFNTSIGEHKVRNLITDVLQCVFERGIDYVKDNMQKEVESISFIVHNENESIVESYDQFVHKLDNRYDETRKFLTNASEQQKEDYRSFIKSKEFEIVDAMSNLQGTFVVLQSYKYPVEEPTKSKWEELIQQYRDEHQQVYKFLQYNFNEVIMEKDGFSRCPRANFIRDAALLSMLSWNIDSQDILVVTNDSDMIKYAQPYYPERLLTLDTYLDKLELKEVGDEIMQRIQDARKQK